MSTASFEHSESMDNLGPALLAVQQAVEQPAKTSKNTYHNSRYADLASCWTACRELCGKNGLTVIQAPCYAGDRMVLVTMLWHTSGEWLRVESPLRPKRTVGDPKPGKSLAEDDPQVFTAGVTYLRRCVLSGIFALTPEDDDGNTAAGVSGKPRGGEPAAPTKRRGRPPKQSAQESATSPADPAPKPAASEPASDADIRGVNGELRPSRAALGRMVLEMAGGDKASARTLCGKLAGQVDPRNISDLALPKAFDAVKAAYAEWQFTQEP